jgi:hypothetical protein
MLFQLDWERRRADESAGSRRGAGGRPKPEEEDHGDGGSVKSGEVGAADGAGIQSTGQGLLSK